VKTGIVYQFQGILRHKLFNCITSCTHVILQFVSIALVMSCSCA